jgi:hypothetical protein
MVIEHFRNGDAVPVYRRFRERGRMAPEGLVYISSWGEERLSTCFEVHAVITSQEAAQRVGPRVSA